MKNILLIGLLFALIHCTYSQSQHRNYPVAESQASAIVQKVLKESAVIDGHNDLFIHYMDCKTCRHGGSFRLRKEIDRG